jgi:hypothetical protein
MPMTPGESGLHFEPLCGGPAGAAVRGTAAAAGVRLPRSVGTASEPLRFPGSGSHVGAVAAPGRAPQRAGGGGGSRARLTPRRQLSGLACGQPSGPRAGGTGVPRRTLRPHWQVAVAPPASARPWPGPTTQVPAGGSPWAAAWRQVHPGKAGETAFLSSTGLAGPGVGGYQLEMDTQLEAASCGPR